MENKELENRMAAFEKEMISIKNELDRYKESERSRVEDLKVMSKKIESIDSHYQKTHLSFIEFQAEAKLIANFQNEKLEKLLEQTEKENDRKTNNADKIIVGIVLAVLSIVASTLLSR